MLHEYMNSSNKERFIGVKASSNYTVLICESKNVISIDLKVIDIRVRQAHLLVSSTFWSHRNNQLLPQ